MSYCYSVVLFLTNKNIGVPQCCTIVYAPPSFDLKEFCNDEKLIFECKISNTRLSVIN